MLKPFDRSRRDGPLYPGSTKTLSDFIDFKHLLRRIDANVDFSALVKFLDGKYDPWIGRPAIHPEVVIRAFLLIAIYNYNLPSERQLCERDPKGTPDNLAWRWFCFLTLEDPVFDHSSLSVFRDRLGAEGFPELLTRLNTELERLGLISPRTYVDSSLVAAHVRTANLLSTELSPAEFQRRAQENEGIYTVVETVPANPDTGEPTRLKFQRYQDAHGRLPPFRGRS